MSNLNGKMTISPEQIRIACQYPKRDNLRQVLAKHWGQTKFDWNKQHPVEDMLPILKQLATPYPNKDPRVVNGAMSLINKIFESKTEAEPEPASQPHEAEPEPASRPTTAKIGGLSWIRGEFSDFTELDAVFYLCMLATVYGLWFLVKDMALFAGPVYLLIGRHALKMTKKRKSQQTAERGVFIVLLLEFAALFIHWNMFNDRLWKYRDMVAIKWHDYPESFFWMAGAMALLLSGGAFYAVSTSLALLKERIQAEDYEAEHGRPW